MRKLLVTLLVGWWFWVAVPPGTFYTQSPYTSGPANSNLILSPVYGPYGTWNDCACQYLMMVAGFPRTAAISSGCYGSDVAGAVNQFTCDLSSLGKK
jgi:hypothetical protein